MSSWSEGALALVIVALIGVGLFVFTGESLSDEPDPGDDVITIDPEAAARGLTLAESQGCLQCHTIDGAVASGPTWKGLAGSSRPLTDGTEVLADDAYLFSSIIDPHSQVVDGYEAIMPTFYADQLSEQQIDDLVEYIKSLAA